MPNTTIEKPRVHFLDSIEEDDNILNKEVTNNSSKSKIGDSTEEVIEEDKEEIVEEEQDEELKEEEDKDKEGKQEEQIDDPEFSFSPFIQELVDSDLIVIPEGKEYDDTTDGFKELIDDNVHLKHEEFKSNLINPVSAQFLEFLEAGGNPDEFIQKAAEIPDYANMDLTDEITLKNLIADHLHIQGYEQEDIKAQLEEYEEIGSLVKHGTTAQKYLIKFAEKELLNITKQQQETEDLRVKSLQKEAEELKDSIYKSSEIGGFKLTKTERDKLYDYITKPVKRENGKIYTQNLLDDSAETKIAIALFKMKKFSFKDIESKVETKQASKLQEQLRKKNDKLTGRTNTITEEETNGKLQGWDWLARK